MKKLSLLFLLISLQSFAQKSVYLFSYFKGNGEDGLHLGTRHGTIFKVSEKEFKALAQ